MIRFFKKLLPFNVAINMLLLLVILILLFHFLVLLLVIPYNIVWAGKINTVQEMYVFESISIVINTLLLFIILIKSGRLKVHVSMSLMQIILWIFVFVFALNTLGNLTSKTNLEKFTATPLTLILSVLFLRVAIDKFDSKS